MFNSGIDLDPMQIQTDDMLVHDSVFGDLDPRSVAFEAAAGMLTSQSEECDGHRIYLYKGPD
jgi:hypothetical protein